MTKQDKTQTNDEVTPESLMEHFHGPGLSKMILITIVVHVAVLFGTSVPFLIRTVSGEDPSERTKEERVKEAVADATASLREIAEKHGLNPKEISDRFSSGTPRKAAAPAPSKKEGPEAKPKPEEPKSAIEKELQQATPGPKAPVFGDDEEDLFK